MSNFNVGLKKKIQISNIFSVSGSIYLCIIIIITRFEIQRRVFITSSFLFVAFPSNESSDFPSLQLLAFLWLIILGDSRT